MSRESDLKQLQDQAQAAYAAGQPVFIARLPAGIWGAPGRGEMDSWAESVTAVESAGWTLEHWSTSADSGGQFNAFPLFRRGVPQDAV